MYTVVVGRVGAGPGRPVVARVPEPEDVSSRNWSLSLNSETTIKRNGAKIALVEFSDFECPFCGRHAHDTLPRLRTDYVNTGRVQYAFKHFPLVQIHSVALDAAKHAACAGKQSRFWDMHDYLFEGQSQLSDQLLTLSAGRLRLNVDAFTRCLNTVSGEISSDQVDGKRLGVTSTPTFFLGRVTHDGVMSVSLRLTGAHPYETFASAIARLAGDPSR